MNRRTFTRALALIGVLLMSLTPALAALAEPAAELVVSNAEVETAPETVEQLETAPEQTEAPTEQPQPSEAPAEQPQEAPAEEQPQSTEAPAEQPQGEIPVDAPQETATRAFDATVSVETDTWKDVNLVRAKGFKGKLAVVGKHLTLRNVQIDGVSADQANLLDYFELAPGAAIACTPSGALRLSFSAMSVNKGASRTLKLQYNGKDVKGEKATWTVSNGNAKVKDGKVTGRKKGAAYVTAKYKKQTAVCRLDVTAIVYPEKVKLTKTLELSLNNTYALKAKLQPKNVTDPTITWTSSNPSVVSVDEKGNLAGLAVGKATVTATACNGKRASCKVTVKAVMPKSLDFRKLYVTMHPGETFQAEIAVKPDNASYLAANYASSDPSVAAVDENGVITALSIGTATITAVSTKKAAAKNTCKVCVIDPDGPRLAGLIIGINPGHQIKTVKKQYPLAPGSHEHAKGVKTGASGWKTRQHEYEVVLQIGLKLRDLLEADGATVVMTRTKNDVMLTNIDRAKMLNAAGVDVALQLHNNSAPTNRKKTGVGGYVRSTGNWYAESKQMSNLMCKAISKTTGFKNQGLHIYNGYMSLNWTTTPSVLLEMGYLSNASDDRLLAQDSFRQKLAQGIYDGLCEYFGR